MYNHRRFTVPAVLALALIAQAAGADEHRQHGSHVHGISHLNVVLDGTTLAIELDSPAANLVGFEHAPRSDAEHAQQAHALARLRKGETLFVLPAEARCRLEYVDVAEEYADYLDEETEYHDEHEEDGHHHSDIKGEYLFHCDTPAALNGIDVQLFEAFPATERLKVQFVAPKGQGGVDLVAGDHYLRF
ncbi:MAG: DUF2796 domain-containing protein [Candidatus Thiodiazotropha sp.]